MLIKADSRNIPLKDKTVQCCCTSPPYWGLRDYGDSNQIGLEKTPEEYVASILAVMREVWRVLRDDGTLWLNLGDSYSSYRDQKQIPQTIGQKSGTSYQGHNGAKNRCPESLRESGLKHKDLVGIPWRVAFALQADGWYLRSDIIWAKPNPMPESVKDRPTKAHEYIFLLSKSERYYFDQEAVREDAAWERWGNQTIVKEQQGTAKWIGARSKSDLSALGKKNIRSVWQIATNPYSGAHFATFPREIPERCIKAGSKPGDVVLDPFCGSGTTVMVAQDLGRIGIGLDLTYQDLAADRIGGSLFKGVVNSAWQ